MFMCRYCSDEKCACDCAFPERIRKELRNAYSQNQIDIDKCQITCIKCRHGIVYTVTSMHQQSAAAPL